MREGYDESELTSSPVFHANPLPTSITTLGEGRYVGVNDAWVRLFGYTCQEVMGNTSLGLNIWVHPEERAKLTQQLNATGAIRDFEHLARTKDGNLRQVLVSAKVIDFNGTRYNLSVVHDVTEIKAREERLNLVMRATNDGIWDWNTRTGEVYYSPRWKSMLGYVDDEIANRNEAWLALVHPEDYERAVARSKADVKGTESEYVLEHRLRHKNGSYRWILSRGIALRDAEGKTYRMVGSHTDITDRKRAEEEMQRQNAYLRALYETTLDVMSELDVDELLEKLLERVVPLVGVAYGWVYLVTPAQDALELKMATGMFRRYQGLRLKRGEGLSGKIFEMGEPLVIENYQAWSGRSSTFEGDAIGPAMGVPLKSKGQVIGVIGLTRNATDASFDEQEQALATQFANLANIAMQNASLHTAVQSELNERRNAEEALQHRLAFERLITNISTEFINLQSDQIDAGIEQSLAAIGRFTGSDRSYVFRFSGDGTQMRNLHEWCRAGILSLKGIYQDVSVSLLPWTTSQIKASQVVHVPRLADLPVIAQADRVRMQSHTDPPLSFINVPMIYQGQVIGLLGFDAVRVEKTWSEEIIALLRIVGEIFVSGLERKRAEEELRKSETRFRTMFENASIGIAIDDMGDVAIQSNPALSKILGYSLEELSHLHTLHYTHPDDYPIQLALENEIASGQRDQYQIEKRYIRKDGGLVWGRMIRSVVRDEQGRVVYRLGMVEDITEQKLAAQKLEEAYRTLEQHVAERTDELATLNAIAASVSRSLDLKEIMADALQRLMELTGMEHGIAYCVGGDQNENANGEPAYLRVMALRGFPPDYANLGDGVPVGESAAGVAGRHSEPKIWSLAELPTQSAIKHRLASQGVQQVIAIPLMAKGRFVGSLNLSTNRLRTYPPEQIALLKTIGQQIGVAVENARLYERAEQSAQMAERSRLARELHDSVTQSLYSMTLYAEATARLLTAGQTEAAAGRLRDLRDTAQEALREMRLLIFELRPPALEHGLVNALQTRLDSVELRGGVQAELHVDGEEHLSLVQQTELYNIALEALNNTLKHAQAHHVQVHLCFAETLVVMEINDDGVGFEPTIAQLGGFGLSGMQERAERIRATLEIDSAVSKGTRVRVCAPIQNKPNGGTP
ncbi:MAG: PAS domain S-box protein [Chloroflexi bacterium]|nr:PAS domain S-box protein [Chloroflexota bacterium]